MGPRRKKATPQRSIGGIERPAARFRRSRTGRAPQAALGMRQIGQCKEAVELRLVFGEAPITRLAVPKEVLDHVAEMLHPSPHLRLGLLQGLLEILQPEKGSSRLLACAL
jgi:hypothetical protein